MYDKNILSDMVVGNVVDIGSNKEGIKSSVETEGEDMESKTLYLYIVWG